MDDQTEPTATEDRRERRKRAKQAKKNQNITPQPKNPGQLARRARYRRKQRQLVASDALTDVDQKIHWINVEYNPVLSKHPTMNETVKLSQSAERIKSADKVYVLQDIHKKEVVGIVKFTPYDEMNDNDEKLLDETCEYIMKEKIFVKDCDINQQKQTGFMAIFGFCKSMQSHEAIGSYIPPDFVKKTPKLFAEWVRRLEFRKRIEKIYGHWFQRLACPIFKNQQTLMKKFKALSFGTLDHKDNQNPNGFGGNLSFTMDCFSGLPHTDGDTPGGWSQGIWFQAFRDSGKMASQADDGYEVKDGEFYWPDFNVIVDFASCDGIVKIIWRGAHNHHCTLMSQETSRKFTRLGTSVHLNHRYALACENIVDITVDEATYIKEPKVTRKRKTDLVEEGVEADGLVGEKKKPRFVKSPAFLVREIGKRFSN